MKKILAILLLLVAAPAWSAVHVCNCGTGAATACAAGNTAASDSNPGTNSALPKQTISAVATAFNSVAAGDSVLLCQGGAHTGVSITLQNLNATLSNPVTLGMYTPPWCDAACQASNPVPLLYNSGAALNIIAFSNGGASVPDGAYRVQDIEIAGNQQNDTVGIFMNRGVNHLQLHRVSIHDVGIGVQCGQAETAIDMFDSYIYDNFDQGVLWACSDSLIETNYFDNNGYGLAIGRGHNLYVESDHPATNITIRGNTSRNNSKGPDGAVPGTTCTSTAFVFHGQWQGLVVESNDLHEETAAAGDGCWGIAIDDSNIPEPERFDSVVVRDNTVSNFAVGIGCNSCINPVFENNVIANVGTGMFFAFLVPDKPLAANTTQSSGATFRSNSIYAPSCNADCIGIHLGFSSQNAGTNLTIVSNLIVFGASANNAHRCFNTGNRTLANFDLFDYNLCYHAGGNGGWSQTYSTLGAAQGAGFDTNGKNSNPLLANTPALGNGFSMAVSTGSPAINAGHPTASASDSFQGCPLVGAPDIGAYGFGCN